MAGDDDIGNDIIVTAQKRAERLRDVPVPVTAVTADALLEQNQTRAQEFFSSVPGLNLQFQNSRSNLAIRGITTGPATGNPVVGYTIDDIPYGSSAGVAGLFGSAPDLDPSELSRIEVLRGPQGTLYGAASIGGLVKYVTVDPSTTAFSGVVGAGGSSVFGADALGYNVRGSVNIPAGDTLAFRASGFTRVDPGYIDNVVTGQRNVNRTEVTGGRLSALWKPVDGLSVKLGALYQQREIGGSFNIDVRQPAFDRQTDNFRAGPSRSETQLYSGIVTANIGAAQLVSLTAYSYNTNYDFVDFSATLLNTVWPDAYPTGGAPVATILRQDYDTRKFTQEVRLSTPIGESIDWIVGGFYTNEKTRYVIETFATRATDGSILGVPILWRDSLTFSEYAAFTDVTARLTDRFDVQVGGRWSSNRQDLNHRQWTIFDPTPNGVFSDPVSRGTALTYLATARYKPSAAHMLYARLATGYRPGGPNALCDGANVPCEYQPDRTTNYELGAKGELAGRALTYDLSLYNIDWKDLQITQIDASGTFNYNANASRARSRGVELALEARPLAGMTLSAWGAYTDATLRQDFGAQVAVYGVAGDRLPYSSRWSGRASVAQDVALSADVDATFGASVTYVGQRLGEFVPAAALAPLRQVYPAYALVDLNMGFRRDDWRFNVFVQNVGDRRGLTGGGFNNQTNYNELWFNFTQPRTVGINIEKAF